MTNRRFVDARKDHGEVHRVEIVVLDPQAVTFIKKDQLPLHLDARCVEICASADLLPSGAARTLGFAHAARARAGRPSRSAVAQARAPPCRPVFARRRRAQRPRRRDGRRSSIRYYKKFDRTRAQKKS